MKNSLLDYIDFDFIEGLQDMVPSIKYINREFENEHEYYQHLLLLEAVKTWVRLIHDIHVDIGIDDLNWNFRLINFGERDKNGDSIPMTSSYGGYTDYNECLEAGLIKFFEILHT